MLRQLLSGRLIRLASPDPDKDWPLFSQWSHDSEYGRMLDATPVRPMRRDNPPDWLSNPNGYVLMVRTLVEDLPIGFVELDGIAWNHGDAWVGIGIGSREHRNRGYGSDALETLMQYAFSELNLYRLSLSVFEYNTRAMRVYEKAGFRVEGRKRGFLHREGRRWDLIIMGILRSEWEKLNESQT